MAWIPWIRAREKKKDGSSLSLQEQAVESYLGPTTAVHVPLRRSS